MVYFCQECGYESTKWMGQCPGCKAWNSFVEEPVSTGKKASGGGKTVSRQQSEPVILKDISLKEDERQTTKIGELDRVLGGGIVPGSLVLVGGDPGIGNPPFFCRCAGIWQRMEALSSIFQARNLCVRSNFVLTVSVLSMRIFSFCAKPIWIQCVK